MNDPVTHGEGRTRFTDFRMEMKTNMPVFKVTFRTEDNIFPAMCSNIDFCCQQLREVSVRRRYSEFKWLRDEVRVAQLHTRPNTPTNTHRTHPLFRV